MPRLAGIPSIPLPRHDANSMLAHEQLVAKARAGRIDLYFLGDSITRRWGCTDPQWSHLLANWKRNFFGWNAGNFGWGGDLVQHMLWRIHHGELDGVNPKAIVILAGTNNVGQATGDDAKVSEIADGVSLLVDTCRAKAPGAAIILMAIFPRNDSMAVMPEIRAINERLRPIAAERGIHFIDIGDRLADADGVLRPGMAIDGLHLNEVAYQAWADALRPLLIELLGPPADVDHAPPATGDPAALR
ncbi:MAG: GDSL-type esterase/lipase family protein [Tepidisphaeraceae bacterium]